MIADRIREAREYVGFSIEQAAERLGCTPEILEAVEAGTCIPKPTSLALLGKLYCRPVAWFRDEFQFEPPAEFLRGAETLTSGDREAVLDFAEFLQCKKAVESDGAVG